MQAHALYVKEKSHAVEAAADSPNLMRWLSNRIATPIDAPNLTEQGFTFIGGRLLPGYNEDGAHGPAAQLMYENAAAERLTLYITAALADKKDVWKFESRDGVEAYYWANDAVTCTIVADLPEKDVRLLGNVVDRAAASARESASIASEITDNARRRMSEQSRDPITSASLPAPRSPGR